MTDQQRVTLLAFVVFFVPMLAVAVATGEWWVLIFGGETVLITWVLESPRFDDPAGWDDVESDWQAWLEGRL